jgi:hypothetical protein
MLGAQGPYIGFEQGGVFIEPHLLLLMKTWLSVFPDSSKGPSPGPHLFKNSWIHLSFTDNDDVSM